MNEMTLKPDAILSTKYADSKHERTRVFWTCVLFGAAMLSILAGLGGVVFSTASWFFNSVEDLGGVGTVLLVALFPLLLLTAHSLDKIKKAEKAIRHERCRRTGLEIRTAKSKVMSRK